MRQFQYARPETAREVIELLSGQAGKASIMAGGTDLLVEIKERLRAPDLVVDIKRLPGIGRLAYDPARGLEIGALVTARAVELSLDVQEHYAGLAQAARELGSIQVRNRATVVGNICRASPSADTLPPLIADGASIRILGLKGERSVALDSFFTGPGKTVLGASEIALGLTVPPPAEGAGKCYIKHGRRKAMELATVGVAVSLTMKQGRCADVRIVLGAVAPTPIRAKAAEAMLRGEAVTDGLAARAGEAAMSEATPISNVRASASYRRRMVGELTRRAIRCAIEEAAR